MSAAPPPVLRVLVLCTGNSARSQMAETLLNVLGKGKIVADSAGSRPAARVNPLAIETLEQFGMPWKGHEPRGIDAVAHENWDMIITVCDNAREECPIFPGQPVTAHWGMPDPADAAGDETAKRAAFRDAFTLLRRRVDLMLALPFDALGRWALETRLRAIASETDKDGGP